MTRRIVTCAVLVGIALIAVRRVDAQSNVPQAWQNETYVIAASQSEIARGQAEMIKAYAAMVQAQAAMVKAQADAAVALANARKIHMDAESARLDNVLKYAKTYWDKKQARDTYLALRNTPMASPGESKHAANGNKPAGQLASAQVTPVQRLTAAELDPVTRMIHWPAALEADRYAQQREALEELFTNRQPNDHGAASMFFAKVRQNVDVMKSLLREEIGKMSPAEYVATTRFLDGLRNEALFPPQINGVAMNQQ
ncbi:MAG: hypothetical protein ACUVQG_08800 [Thermogutta sp.]